jgi:hypothetical protein
MFIGFGACGGKLMINRYFQVHAPEIDTMHAEPIAALAALKLASLALPSTHSPRYGQGLLEEGVQSGARRP